MKLTDKEGTVIWPIYEAYQKELLKIQDHAAQMVEAYVESCETLSYETAEKLLNNYFEIQRLLLQHKQSYAKKLRTALPMKRVVRYLQIENKVEAISNYGAASIVPLMK